MRWFLLVVLGCRAHSPTGTMTEKPERYHVRIGGEFGPITVMETGDVLQPAMTIALELRVRLVPTRRFADGSYGRLMHVDGAQITRTDGSQTVNIENQLTGRSVELRTFPDGEILDISWGEKVAGQGRYLDVFDVVFPAVSPAAPSLADGERAKRSLIWPLRQSKMFRWDNTVEASWLNEGPVDILDVPAWALRYDGEWFTKGVTREARPPRQWDASGQSNGTIHFAQDGSDMIEHRLDWRRTVSVRGLGGIAVQEQRFVGTVERY